MQLIKTKTSVIESKPIIYEVNLTIDNDVIDEFDAWLQKHIDEMLAIPGFISAATLVLENNDDNTKQRSVQYRLVNQEALDTYFEKDAERMRAEGLEKFSNKLTAQRRILTPTQAALAEEAVCANCGTQLEGRFCSSCGQREEPRVPTFMAMLREVTNAMFGLESKLWKSIAALFFMPGHLTNTYLSGRRQKYTTPFRIYLLFSIIAFAMISIYSARMASEVNVGNKPADLQSVFDEINAEIAEESKNNKSTQGNKEPIVSEDRNGIEPESNSESSKDLNEFIEELEFKIGLFPTKFETQVEEKMKGSLRELRTDIENNDVDALVSKLIQPVPKVLLLFLPFIALVFKILFLGRGKYYVEHLIYLIHNHAFLFALLIITVALLQLKQSFEYLAYPVAVACNLVLIYFSGQFFIGKIKKNYPSHKFKVFFYAVFFSIVIIIIYNITKNANGASTIVLLWVFYAPYYIYRSMRVVYKSSRFVTVGSFGIIFLTYVTLFLTMAILYIVLSAFLSELITI